MSNEALKPCRERLLRLLEALAFDCDNTDGWEDAAPIVREAIDVIRSTDTPVCVSREEMAKQEIQRLREALEQIGGLNGENYDSDRAWALAMQLRANTALRGWLSSQENKDDR